MVVVHRVGVVLARPEDGHGERLGVLRVDGMVQLVVGHLGYRVLSSQAGEASARPIGKGRFTRLEVTLHTAAPPHRRGTYKIKYPWTRKSNTQSPPMMPTSAQANGPHSNGPSSESIELTVELVVVDVELEKYVVSHTATAVECRRAETMMSAAETMNAAATARALRAE